MINFLKPGFIEILNKQKWLNISEIEKWNYSIFLVWLRYFIILVSHSYEKSNSQYAFNSELFQSNLPLE